MSTQEQPVSTSLNNVDAPITVNDVVIENMDNQEHQQQQQQQQQPEESAEQQQLDSTAITTTTTTTTITEEAPTASVVVTETTESPITISAATDAASTIETVAPTVVASTTTTAASATTANTTVPNHFGVPLKSEPVFKKPDETNQSVDVGGGVRRKATDTDALTYRRYQEIGTTYEAFKASVERSPNHNCLGYRPLNEKGEAGPFKWISYGEVNTRAHHIASGLLHLGVSPKQHIGIYSKNRPEWQIAARAADTQSLVTIALYDTLGEESSLYIMNHGEVVAIFVTSETLPKLLKYTHECTHLKLIVSFDKFTDEQKQMLDGKINLVTLEELENMGKENPAQDNPPSPDDLMSIMYTSGTTGMPKGVMLTQYNMQAASSTIIANLSCSSPFLPEDSLISYLPLAHILQRVAEETFLQLGCSIGYYQGNVLKLVDDLQELKPSFITAVPRVLDKFYDKITGNVSQAGKIKKWMFNMALSKKKLARMSGAKTGFYDKVVFKKIQAVIGGRVKCILSGGAPLRPEVHELLSCCFNCVICQGYGLTETCAAATIQLQSDPSLGHIGCPVPSIEIKLESVPDMNYFADANPPTGEICLRGPPISQGYYKDPEKTAEVFDKDGWFHTGDVGRWNPNGTLSIIDRKKNIFKLSQGEYVASEAVEAKLVLSPYLSRIWIYGDSMKSFLVAVGVVDPDQFVRLAKDNNIENASVENLAELVKNPALNKLVLQNLDQVAVQNKLQGFEKVKAIHLVAQDFDAIDCVTPTQKLQRAKLQAHFQQQLDEMYAATEKSLQQQQQH